jgi:hypothetical protein
MHPLRFFLFLKGLHLRSANLLESMQYLGQNPNEGPPDSTLKCNTRAKDLRWG